MIIATKTDETANFFQYLVCGVERLVAVSVVATCMCEVSTTRLTLCRVSRWTDMAMTRDLRLDL
jgi:hypothetical protein